MTPGLLCRLLLATDSTAMLRHPARVKNTRRNVSTQHQGAVVVGSKPHPGAYHNASAIPRKAARARSAPHCRPNSVFSTGRYFSGGLRSRSRLTVNSMSPSASSRQCSISVKYASAGKNRNSLRARQRACFCGSLKCTRQNLLSR